MTVDTSGWTPIGRSANAEFFEIDARTLAVLPFEGAVDDAATARESVRIQLAHLRAAGRRSGVVVFMDRVVAQDAGARAVYRDEPDPAFQACFALVGGTPFGRAVGAIFIGLSPPRVPTRLFPTLEAARAWVSQVAGIP
jgi:hypothetical protein